LVISLTDAFPSHPGTLEEVRERVFTDYRGEQAVALAKSRAEQLAQRAKTGDDLAAAARALGFEAQTSDLVARSDSIPDVGSASQLALAFSAALGQSGDAVFLGANWAVFRVLEHQPANPSDLSAQRQAISEQVLQSKREMAYEAFKSSLETRLRSEGKLVFNEDNLQRLINSTL
jgi:hypothetical protein